MIDSHLYVVSVTKRKKIIVCTKEIGCSCVKLVCLDSQLTNETIFFDCK